MIHSSRSESRQRLGRVAIAILATLALVFGSSSVALESPNVLYYDYDGVNIRQCAYTSCTSNGQGFTGQWACYWFWVSGENVSGVPGDTMWCNHTNLSTSVSGYSWHEYMHFIGTDPQCA